MSGGPGSVSGANPLRGEVALQLAGQSYILRPSFAALVRAEEEFGSLFAMVERASEGRLTVAEISGMLWHCADPALRPDRESFGEAILALGLVEAAKPMRVIFAQVLKGQA